MTAVDRSLPTRIPAPRKVLKSLHSILIRIDRVRRGRATRMAEIAWCDFAFDSIKPVVEKGYKDLPPHVDPRDQRRVRKRKRI